MSNHPQQLVSKALELLQHPARRRPFLRRLRRAVDVSALPQDGRRAEPPAVQQAGGRPGGLRLAEPAGQGRRRVGDPLPARAGNLGQAAAGCSGLIFRKAQNKIQDPAKLRRLIVDLIDKEQWTSLSADVKGDAYEGLLAKERRGREGRGGPIFHPARR